MSRDLYIDMFELFAVAPDTQLDGSMARKFKQMDPYNFTSDQILEILDECAHASLASDFAMMCMNVLWETKVAEEGKTTEQAMMEATDRRKARYGQ